MPWDIIVPVAVGVVGALWGWWKGKNPKKAASIRRWEQKLKSAAAQAFFIVEVTAKLTGWNRAQKITEYRRRVQTWAKERGVPLSLEEIERLAETWSSDWSVEEKTDQPDFPANARWVIRPEFLKLSPKGPRGKR